VGNRTCVGFCWAAVTLAGLVCGTVPRAAAAAAECTLGAVAVLPVRAERGHYLFTAQINEHPANLVLDTGFFATSLNLEAGDRLGVRLNRIGREAYGIGGVRDVYSGTARHMRVGQMNADGMVLGGGAYWTARQQPGWDGVFGMNMMSAYDIDLDFAGGYAILFEADGDCHHPTVGLAPPLYKVPLEAIAKDRQADILITIDGQRVKALLDTGAFQSFIYRKAAARLGVDVSVMDAPGHEMASGIGPFAVKYFRHIFHSVKIGPLEVHDMEIGILNQKDNGINRIKTGSLLPSALDPDAPNTEDMVLGLDFFQRFHAWISHSSQNLILQYPPAPSVLPH